MLGFRGFLRLPHSLHRRKTLLHWHRRSRTLVLAIAFGAALAGPSLGQSIDQRLTELLRTGKYSQAVALAEQYIAQRPEDAVAAAWLAFLYKKQGRLGEAEPLAKRALTITEERLPAGHPDIATSLDLLAGIYRAQGRLKEAEPLYERRLQIAEKALPPSDPRIADAVRELGLLYGLEGRISEAEPLLQRAREIREKALPESDPAIAASLNDLAILYGMQGRLQEAESLARRALEIREKALPPEALEIAGSLTNLASLYQRQHRLADAEPLFRRALAITQRALPPNDPAVATSLSNLGVLYLRQGRPTEGAPLIKRALTIRETSLPANDPQIPLSLDDLSIIEFQLGHFEAALELARRTTALLVGRDDRFKYRRQFWRHIRVMRRVTERNPRREPGLQEEAFRTAQMMLQSKAAQALAQMSARFAAADPALGRLVRERQDLQSQWQATDKQLIASLSLAVEDRHGADEHARNRLRDIDTRTAAIDSELKARFPNYAALANPQPVSLSDAAQLIRSDDALVVFVIDEEESFVFALTRRGLQWRSLGEGKRLSDLVQRIMRPLQVENAAGRAVEKETAPQSSSAGTFDLAAAHELYRLLIGPVADAIKDKAHWIIVPDGPLTGLPFQLLLSEAPTPRTTTKAAHWLIRDRALRVLPAVSSLQALRNMADKPRTATLPFIGFGDPVIGNDPGAVSCAAFDRAPQMVSVTGETAVRSPAIDVSALGGRSIDPDGVPIADVGWLRRQPRLTEARCEIQALARAEGADVESTVHVGAHATETEVKDLSAVGELKKYRVIAFATHGLLPSEAKGVAEAGLILTPPAVGTARDDGLLTASEVAALDLDAEWVILSACNTAAGEKPGTETLSGLARAFFYAGARALLVSHWPVDSRAAVLLTTRTLGEFERNPGIGKAEALRRAMLSLLAADMPDAWSHPRLWAPFALVGEGG
jgi:CHAT domain-containing protein/Tfp pilus assembly protein PilF